ncbi:MAG: NAD-dependent epimerase/dehydratase family protein [Bacteroidota bacterium]
MDKILIIGSNGQLGTELTASLRSLYGTDQVIASDIRSNEKAEQKGPFEILDVMDENALTDVVRKHKVTQIYHLAAILSAKGEENPEFAWNLNMKSLLSVLGLAKDQQLDRVYWPSSIAVFGPDTPSDNTPQNTVMNPNTVYGISKLAGERWCEYYHQKYGVDVRSLRYPGLIGYKSLPGGGTTDYAVDIYYKALEKETFRCFLKEDTRLPMMYMDDAVRATIDLMESASDKIKIRSSYNIGATSFTPEEITDAIRKYIPEFISTYEPDFRQQIADSWPNSIDDSAARSDWGWNHEFDLDKMTKEILTELGKVVKPKLVNH